MKFIAISTLSALTASATADGVPTLRGKETAVSRNLFVSGAYFRSVA